MGVFASRENSSSSGMAVVVPGNVAALTKAKNIVAKNPVVVFSKSYCPYCIKAKKLLTSLGAKPAVLELDEEPDGAEIQRALAEWTGQRTVPNVFVGGKHLGGCDDTITSDRLGKLLPMLQEAGALGPAAKAPAAKAAAPPAPAPAVGAPPPAAAAADPPPAPTVGVPPPAAAAADPPPAPTVGVPPPAAAAADPPAPGRG